MLDKFIYLGSILSKAAANDGEIFLCISKESSSFGHFQTQFACFYGGKCSHYHPSVVIPDCTFVTPAHPQVLCAVCDSCDSINSTYHFFKHPLSIALKTISFAVG